MDMSRQKLLCNISNKAHHGYEQTETVGVTLVTKHIMDMSRQKLPYSSNKAHHGYEQTETGHDADVSG